MTKINQTSLVSVLTSAFQDISEEKTLKGFTPGRQILVRQDVGEFRDSEPKSRVVRRLFARHTIGNPKKKTLRLPRLPGHVAYTAVEGTQIDQIMNEKWGDVFLDLALGLNLTMGNHVITAAEINSMFKWGYGCGDNLLLNPVRGNYARAIVDLLKIKPDFFERIIRACYANHVQNQNALPGARRPEAVIFVNKRGSSGLIFDDDLPGQCELNLEGKGKKASWKYIEGVGVLLVRNVASNQLDFMGVTMPVVVELAHELAHFVWALETPRGAGLSVYTSVENRAQGIYNLIIQGIVPNPLPPVIPPEIRIFTRLWNHGIFSEIVNILPSTNISNDGGATFVSPGGFNYSDGEIIKMALATWPVGDSRRPRFFAINNFRAGIISTTVPPPGTPAAAIGTQPNAIISSGQGGNVPLPGNAFFARFSHADSVYFLKKLNKVRTQGIQAQFDNLIVRLLNKINISGKLILVVMELYFNHVP